MVAYLVLIQARRRWLSLFAALVTACQGETVRFITERIKLVILCNSGVVTKPRAWRPMIDPGDTCESNYSFGEALNTEPGAGSEVA